MSSVTKGGLIVKTITRYYLIRAIAAVFISALLFIATILLFSAGTGNSPADVLHAVTKNTTEMLATIIYASFCAYLGCFIAWDMLPYIRTIRKKRTPYAGYDREDTPDEILAKRRMPQEDERLTKDSDDYLPLLGYWGRSQIFLSAKERLENIVILGQDYMRKLTGFVLPVIFSIIENNKSLIIIDDENGSIFKHVYAALLRSCYRVFVIDADDLSRSGGYNVLASAYDSDSLHNLASVIATGTRYEGRFFDNIATLLEFVFFKVRQIESDATLEDAYEYLQQNAIIADDLLDTSWEDKSYRAKEVTENFLYRDKWEKVYSFALSALAPYANDPSLSMGLRVQDMFAGLKDMKLDKTCIIARPPRSKCATAPIFKHIVYEILSFADSACIEKGKDIWSRKINSYKETLTVVIYYSPILEYHCLWHLISTGTIKNIQYCINLVRIRRNEASRFLGTGIFDCTVLTGTPDEATAEFLSEKSGQIYGAGISRNVFTKEELLAVGKEDLYVIHSGRGAILKKSYYKHFGLSECTILDTKTGKSGPLEMDDFDINKAGDYEAVFTKASEVKGVQA